MNSKLTLSIDPKVIDSAKEYARSQKRSLSNIVEEYLKSISFINQERIVQHKEEMDPLVKSLWGSVKLPEGKEYEDILAEALFEKHLK